MDILNECDLELITSTLKYQIWVIWIANNYKGLLRSTIPRLENFPWKLRRATHYRHFRTWKTTLGGGVRAYGQLDANGYDSYPV